MVVSTYDEIAEWYDEWAGDSIQDDPFFPEVEALMGDIAGQRVCDLACGQGRTSRRLADLGAQVVGVDLSANLLEIACRHEEAAPRGIEYLLADARHLDGMADETFDGVVCFMALMDFSDLAAALHSVERILRPGGWFVFATLHPCYNTSRSEELEVETGWVRTIGGYFTEGHWISDVRTGPPGKVGAYHRTLSTYFNALTDAGLMLERMSEPSAITTLSERRPVWAEVPAVLIARCRKVDVPW